MSTAMKPALLLTCLVPYISQIAFLILIQLLCANLRINVISNCKALFGASTVTQWCYPETLKLCDALYKSLLGAQTRNDGKFANCYWRALASKLDLHAHKWKSFKATWLCMSTKAPLYSAVLHSVSQNYRATIKSRNILERLIFEITTVARFLSDNDIPD